MNFIPDWESEIVQISQKIDVIAQKWELFRKKTVLLKDFFQASRNPVIKKESIRDEGSNTKFSYQMLPWISCKAT